ncbi:MAG: hypothetical protein UHH95_07080 [Oscillospiraceae bacterium]|nr:hypothetical protein [Oscillospiraceae bacterium]
MSKSEIRFEGNKPCLYVDGKPITPILYGLSDFPGAKANTAYAQRNIARFAKAGINLVNIDSSVHIGWQKTEAFQPEAIIEEISSALDANPNAKLLMRLHMNPPYWWMRDNPDECIIYRKPEGDVFGIDDGDSDRLIRNDHKYRMRVSLASEKWLSEVSEILKELCAALKNTREGDALLGIQVACGMFGEWHYWGRDTSDVSRSMLECFHRYLKEKYGTDEALQKAWNQKDVTIENAVFRPEGFRPGDVGMFRDPQLSRDTMDAQECHHRVQTDAIMRFCRIIKENLPGVLTGAFYGYYMGCSSSISGHVDVLRLYKSGVVDFLCGPFAYMQNREPEGVPLQRGLLESNRLRGMLWLTEMDQYPICVPRLGGDLSKKDQAIAVLRRNVLQPILAGMGLWFYDHRVVPSILAKHPEMARAASIYHKDGWWEDEYLMQEIEALRRIAEEHSSQPYIPAADVLVVFDVTSGYGKTTENFIKYPIPEAVARAGVSYDSIYIDELELAEIDRYRCVIIAGCSSISPERRKKIREMLKDCTTVWLYDSGFCDGDTLSCDHMSETVGIKLCQTEEATQYTACGFLPDITLDISEELCNPFFAACDKEAQTLALYNTGAVAAAAKGNDIWLGVPFPTPEIMTAIISRSGAHRYTDCGNPVLASGRLVAVNCGEKGTETLTLRNGKTLSVSLPPYTTAVFDAVTGERVL